MQKHIAVLTDNSELRSVLNEALNVLAHDVNIDLCLQNDLQNHQDLDVILCHDAVDLTVDDLQLTFVIALRAGAGIGQGQLYDYSFSEPFRLGKIMDRVSSVVQGQALGRIPRRLDILNWQICFPENTLVSTKGDGCSDDLTDKEGEILRCLFRAGDKGVRKQQLLNDVWAYHQDVETHTLETHIYRLRQKMEQDPSAPEILVTESDGYYLKR